jgi:hypothetical protein
MEAMFESGISSEAGTGNYLYFLPAKNQRSIGRNLQAGHGFLSSYRIFTRSIVSHSGHS